MGSIEIEAIVEQTGASLNPRSHGDEVPGPPASAPLPSPQLVMADGWSITASRWGMSLHGHHYVDDLVIGLDAETSTRVVVLAQGGVLLDEVVPYLVLAGQASLGGFIIAVLEFQGVELDEVQAEGVTRVGDELAALVVLDEGYDQTDTAELIVEVIEFLRLYVVMTADQYIAVALWIIHTHVIDAAHQTPYLNIRSAEKQCGKTRLLELLELLCAKANMWIRPSEAVLYRKIHADCPTVLLDEVDAIWNDKGQEHEGVRAAINAGARRGASVPRCVGPTNAIQEFNVFCPKALCGIGLLPDTIADRSIPIVMKRRTSDEPVKRFRRRYVEPEAAALHSRIEDWAVKHVEKLAAAEPALPEEFGDRQQDVVELPLAIADLAGSEWAQGARQALVALLTETPADAGQSPRLRLLNDVRTVVQAMGSPERVKTEDLLNGLLALEDSDWSTYGGLLGSLTKAKMARMLRHYDVSPKQLRFPDGSSVRGYEVAALADAWKRYVPAEPVTLP